jgi:ABC-type glycerol-3-phosphate transport system substrate-binding protein
MKNLSRIISAFLAIVLLSAIVAGCGSEEEEDPGVTAATFEDTAEVTEETTVSDEPELPETDLEGKEYQFLVRNGASSYNDHWIEVEEMNGEVVNDAVFERNRAVEERFNIDITALLSPDPNTIAEKSVLAGENSFFAVWDRKTTLASGIQKNIYLDISNLPYADFTAPYWDKNAVEQLSIAKKLYMMPSDISMSNLTAPRFLYFNKRILENYGLTSPYDYVADDCWTLDNFLPMVAAVSSDLDGDGKMTREDEFGMLREDFSSNGNILYFLVGCGVRATTNDKDGIPQISFYNDKTQTIIDKVSVVFKDENCTIEYNNCASGADISQFDHLWEYCRSLFAAGHFLFVQNGCYETIQFNDMEDDYGIVPNPKYDESQKEYYHRTDPLNTLMAIPATNIDLENTGMILEWMSWKSHHTVLPAYYETTIKLKRQRDETAIEMLDIIKGSMYYEIADIFVLDVSGVIWESYSSGNLASTYAKFEKMIQNNIDKLVDNLLSVG